MNHKVNKEQGDMLFMDYYDSITIMAFCKQQNVNRI